MRIGGLASGMDIDSLVSDLMKAERIPLDKLQQRKQKLEWQRDDYREISSMMLNLNKFLFDDLILSNTYNQKTVNISNPEEISIRNINSKNDFSGTIKVIQLAKSSTFISGETGVNDSSKTLNELFGLTGTQEVKIRAIKADGTMDSTGKTLSFNPMVDSLSTVISRINNETGVSAFFDSQTGKLAITAKNTGDVSGQDEMILSNVQGSLFSALKLDNSDPLKLVTKIQGVNSEFTYNGLTTTRPSNVFTINGFELTLKNNSGEDVTFNSSADVDKILEKLVKFVDDYNKLIEKVNGKLVEKNYRDYLPLTKEQKEAMEEKEIELWEEKARSGLLRNDSILSSALNKMRTALYTPVSGLSGMNQLSDFGITTSINYRDKGKLVINEDKLREAITKDPKAIYDVFAKDSTNTQDKGIARRIRDILQGDSKHPDEGVMDALEKKAGTSNSVTNSFSIGKLLNNVDDQINRFEDRLIQIEDRYWSQFTAMEKAIQRANQQSAYLMQNFFSG